MIGACGLLANGITKLDNDFPSARRWRKGVTEEQSAQNVVWTGEIENRKKAVDGGKFKSGCWRACNDFYATAHLRIS